MEIHPKDIELQRAAQELVRQELWRRGVLSWKFHCDQFSVYEEIQRSRRARYLLEIARRWGKTFLLATIATETCLRKAKARVVYGAPTLTHLEQFIIPTFDTIFADAPADCRPVWRESKNRYIFPNGSVIQLFGADDKRKANRGRGPAADLCIFDEAGFCPILKYVIATIFRPQLQNNPNGRILLGSTPAEEPDHDFTEMAERAEANGNYARRTIYDNPRLTPEQITQFIEDDAKEEGMTREQYEATDTFRREYLAERVIDKLLVVVPEWADVRDECRIAVPRPEYFNGMTMVDWGGNDPHAVAFGYWHFEVAKWVIEDELCLRNGENSAVFAELLKQKERELWGTNKWEGTMRGARDEVTQTLLDCLPDWMAAILTKEEEAQQQPFTRWCDNSNIPMIRDFYELHGIALIPTAKDNKEAQVNNLRVMFRSKQVLIHPRCVATDRHLRQTTWANHRRKDYARKAGEHGDGLDALLYGARNLDKRNPIPAHLRLVPTAGMSRGRGPIENELGGSALSRLIQNSRKR